MLQSSQFEYNERSLIMLKKSKYGIPIQHIVGLSVHVWHIEHIFLPEDGLAYFCNDKAEKANILVRTNI